MKVLQINSVCGIGSTGRIATDIHNELIKKGYESYIAYGRGEAKNIELKHTIKIGNKFDQALHLIKTRLFDRHGFGSKRATKKLIKEIEILNPDVIHLHNLHGYYINIKILFNYLKKSNKKIIWTLHDCWPFTGHSAYFSYPKIEGWTKDGIHNCEGKKRYPKSILLDRKKKNGIQKKSIFSEVKDLTIVTPSNWLKELVEQSYLKQYKANVINNGIDVRTFKPIKSNFKKKYNLEDKKVILGVASVWDLRKGLKTFLELSKYLNENEIIVLVGLSRRQMKKLPKNIFGITKTDNITELVEIYNGADIFFNPTMEDNYPTVNLEALASGAKVLSFDSGGSRESALKGNGRVIDSKTSIIEIYKQVGRMISSRESSSAQDNISKELMIEEYIKLYCCE